MKKNQIEASKSKNIGKIVELIFNIYLFNFLCIKYFIRVVMIYKC